MKFSDRVVLFVFVVCVAYLSNRGYELVKPVTLPTVARPAAFLAPVEPEINCAPPMVAGEPRPDCAPFEAGYNHNAVTVYDGGTMFLYGNTLTLTDGESFRILTHGTSHGGGQSCVANCTGGSQP